MVIKLFCYTKVVNVFDTTKLFSKNFQVFFLKFGVLLPLPCYTKVGLYFFISKQSPNFFLN